MPDPFVDRRFRTLDDVRRRIEAISQAESRRTLKRWTVGQIYYHLAAAFAGSVRELPPGYSRTARLMARPFRFLLIRGWFPQGLPIPAAIADQLAPPADADEQQQRTRLLAAIDAFEQHTGPLPPHPVLGPLSRDEWIGFHLRHCQLHLGQIAWTNPAADAR
jgi:hypothetical protein